MARPAIIHYQKVTLSLPLRIVEMLDSMAEKGDKSRFVAEAIEAKAEQKKAEMDVHAMFAEFRKNYKPLANSQPSIEIIREIRYGKI